VIVLAVDDEQIRPMITEVLTAQGYFVKGSESGREAIDGTLMNFST
jgi:DNA-binding response OmpR family regulator